MACKQEDAFVVLTIKVKPGSGKIREVSIGAGGVDQDGNQAKITEENAGPDGLLDLHDEKDLAKIMGGSNPCIWFNIGGRLKKVCW